MEWPALPQVAIGLPSHLRCAGEEAPGFVGICLRRVDGVEGLLEFIGEAAGSIGRLEARGENSLEERNREIAQAVVGAKWRLVTDSGDQELAGVLVVVD